MDHQLIQAFRPLHILELVGDVDQLNFPVTVAVVLNVLPHFLEVLQLETQATETGRIVTFILISCILGPRLLQRCFWFLPLLELHQ